MRTFTKRTVVLLAAGTFTLASLGVLATQPTSSGMWGHNINNPMNSGYDRNDSHMSTFNWFGQWWDRGSGRYMMDRDDMMDRGYMMDADCRHDMDWHSNRGRSNTLPQVGQNHQEGRDSSSSTALTGTDEWQYGRSLVADIGCQGCHQIGSDGGRFGPPLNSVVSRQGEDFVRSKLENPRFDNNYSRMPNFDLSDEEISAIVAYLITLDGA